MPRGGRYGVPGGFGGGGGGDDEASSGGSDDDDSDSSRDRTVTSPSFDPGGFDGSGDGDDNSSGGGGDRDRDRDRDRDDDSSPGGSTGPSRRGRDDRGGSSPGGSSPPTSDVGGPGTVDSNPDAGIDPSDTPAAGVVGDPGGEIDPSDTPAAGTVGGGGGGDDGSSDPLDPSETDAATEFSDPVQGVETDSGRVGEIASGFEQEVIGDRGLAPEDVRITRDDDQLVAELTGTGQTELQRRAVEEQRDDAERQARLDRRQAARDADPGGQPPFGGDQRLFNEERELRREAAAEEEQFGDIAVGSPVSDNRLEADLETGAEQFRDDLARAGITFSTVGTPSIATGQFPQPSRRDEADLEGLDAQVYESLSDAFNPFGIAAGGKEIAEFAATQPQRVADPDRRGEFVDDVEQRANRIASSTASRAQENPVEFAVGTALGLGFGAVGGGAAASASRRLSGGRIDLGSDLSGRALEAGARRFLDDDRAQADLSGFGRGDSDAGSGGGLSDELDEALSNFEESGSLDLPDDPGRISRVGPEQDREADVDPSDPFQRRRDRAQRDGPDETTTGNLGLDERPTRGTNTREDPLPDTLPDQIGRDRGDTVDDALGRRQDAQQRFDAAGSGLGLGAFGSGSLFGVGENAATGTGVGAVFGSPGVETGTGVGSGAFGDVDIFGDTGIRGDTDIRSDVGTRTDTDTRTGLDTGFDSRADTTFRSDTRTDTDLDRRFDFRQDFEFSDDEQDNDDPFLFGTVSRSDTVDSGLQSGDEALEDLFGDDPFSL